MKTGQPKQHVCLSSEEKEQLQSTGMGSSGSLRYGLVTRVRTVLRAAEGASNREIAGKIGLSAQSPSANGAAPPGPGSLWPAR